MKNKDFNQGYICAVANIHQHIDQSTVAAEALAAIGIESVKDLRKNGADDYDVEILRPVIKGIQSAERWRKRQRCKAKLKKG